MLKFTGALVHADFRHYWLARFLGSFSAQIMGVSVGWQIYDITRDPLDLGLVGLILFLPAVLLVLVTGTVADRFNRVVVTTICLVGEGVCALALLAFTVFSGGRVGPIFLTLLALGIVRAFFSPAQQALIINLVPREDTASAIVWSTTSWQVASVLGPIAGGLLYSLSPEGAYTTAFVLLCIATVLSASIRVHPASTAPQPKEHPRFETLMAGFRYIWREKIVLGAISLDLFAMMLGGATALLPVYARDILTVGPWGLGLLRAAPSIGAILVGAFLLRWPVKDKAGVIMFTCVAMVGVAITVFGATTQVWLSVTALALMGGLYQTSLMLTLGIPKSRRI